MNPSRSRRTLGWWIDDPDDPGRMALQNPAVQRLIAEIAPGSSAVDLGGTFSLNVLIEGAGLVLRVNPALLHRSGRLHG